MDRRRCSWCLHRSKPFIPQIWPWMSVQSPRPEKLVLFASYYCRGEKKMGGCRNEASNCDGTFFSRICQGGHFRRIKHSLHPNCSQIFSPPRNKSWARIISPRARAWMRPLFAHDGTNKGTEMRYCECVCAAWSHSWQREKSQWDDVRWLYCAKEANLRRDQRGFKRLWGIELRGAAPPKERVKKWNETVPSLLSRDPISENVMGEEKKSFLNWWESRKICPAFKRPKLTAASVRVLCFLSFTRWTKKSSFFSFESSSARRAC